MKVTIVGGGGRVGSCAAFALQCAGLVAQIQIRGIEGQVEIKLWPKEHQGLQASAKALKDTLAKVKV